jgi:uncharacterized delta-60 repeat protein
MPTRARTAAASALVLLAFLATVAAASGELPLRPDPSFGRRGIAIPRLPPHFEYTSFRSVRVEPDGSLLASRHDGGNGEDYFTYRRYDAAGRLDRSFEPKSEGPAREAVDVDGKVLRANTNVIERFNADGSRDLSYGTDPSNGRPFSDFIRFRIERLLLTPSRKLLVAGSALRLNQGEEEVRQIVVARFDQQGHLDPGFGGDGVVELETEAAIAGQGFVGVAAHGEEGAIVVFDERPRPEYEGQAVKPGGSVVLALAADGRPDPSFGEAGVVRSDSSIEAFSALPDGTLVLAGNRWGEEVRRDGVRTSDLYAARLTPAGRYDPGFDGDGVAIVDFGGLDLAETVLSTDGSVLLGGSSTEIVDSTCIEYESRCRETPVLARLLPNGALDPGFGDGGRVRLGALSGPFVVLAAGRGVRTLAPRPGGGVVAGGGSGTAAFLAELDGAGALVPGFGSGGIAIERDREATEAQAHAVAVDGRRRILVAGSTDADALFSFESGAVFRFRPDGKLDRGYGGGAGYVRVPGNTRDIAAGAGGDAYLLSGEFGPNIVVHVTPRGALDRRFGDDGVARLPDLPPVHRNGKRHGREFDPRSIAVMPDGGALVGGEGGGGSEARIVLVRFERFGHLDRSFGNRGVAILGLGRTRQCNMTQLEVRRDGRILIAGRVREKGEHGRRPALFQLLADGSPDPSFGRRGVAGANLDNEGVASSLAIARDGSVLLGGWQVTHGRTRALLLRFSRRGVLDRGFARRAGASAPTFGFSPRQILPTAAGIFTVSQYSTALAFSRRGAFRAAIPFAADRKPRRYLMAGAVQAGRPLLVGQIGEGRRIVLRRYLTG